MSGPPTVHELFIPGDATRRQYAVYLIVIQERAARRTAAVYVGKVGDNREGCNPVASRIGNHLSFNKVHSQTRNLVNATADYDYRVFFAFFGEYVDPKTSRAGISLVNEMERELNRRAQEAFGSLVANPWKGTGSVNRVERARRAAMHTLETGQVLDAIIEAARTHVLIPTSEPRRA
jgi:hypothetical protein